MGVQAQRKSPLDRFRCFETTDVDEARQIVAQHFCSHRLDSRKSDDRFDARQNRAQGLHVSLNYIRYGADVMIEPGELTAFYLIQIPVRGAAEIANGSQWVLSTRSMASVLNPDRHTRMRWHAGCEKVLLQVEQGYLQSVAEKMAGTGLGRVRFATGLDLKRQDTASWCKRLAGLVKAAEAGAAFSGAEERSQALLEEELVGALLMGQPNTASPMLERRDTGAIPAILKRARELICERFREDIGLMDISAHARTTPRNLQILFKREFGAGPVQVLHDMRLRYARHLLLTEGSNRSIAEIADVSGHSHMGRFSVAYKKRFGESPRDTRSTHSFS